MHLRHPAKATGHHKTLCVGATVLMLGVTAGQSATWSATNQARDWFLLAGLTSLGNTRAN